jgi:hypothetical protein
VRTPGPDLGQRPAAAERGAQETVGRIPVAEAAAERHREHAAVVVDHGALVDREHSWRYSWHLSRHSGSNWISRAVKAGRLAKSARPLASSASLGSVPCSSVPPPGTGIGELQVDVPQLRRCAE